MLNLKIRALTGYTMFQWAFIGLVGFTGFAGLTRVSYAEEPLSVPAVESEAQKIPMMEDVQRFSVALGLIKQYYVKSTTDDHLFDDAIKGMLTGLDPHSSYLNEEDFKELQSATNGQFAGLGLEVTMEEGVVKVISPLSGSPADVAGIKSGDYIIKLDNKVVQGMELKEAVNLMRGAPGSSITLTVLRKGETKPLVLNVVRQNISMQSVKSKLFDNQYGYIRLTQFQALTYQDMEKALAKLKEQAKTPLKGLILDLRNNPGGLLDSAIQVSDAFLDGKQKNEIIVYTEGRLPGSKFTAYANAGDVLNKAPLIVLINGGSASASEIVAGALQDHKRAIIVGTKSFGKGSVQTVLPLDNKHGIKLTTALYFTPNGTSIQAKGIMPDIVINEVKMPEIKSESLSGFSESELSGHLLNGNGNNNAAKSASNIQEMQKLMHEDYQLYSALTVLQGLVVARH